MFYTAEEISTNIADDLLYINDLECRSMFNNVIAFKRNYFSVFKI